MRSFSLPKLIIISFLIIFMLSGLYFLQFRINHIRKGSNLDTMYLDPLEAIPITLLGSFRGVLVDFLWIRGIARHEERKFYELLAINNLITKLQPHFPSVWIFQAWNMCYNIAHEWESPENKWKWIKTGLNFAEKGASKNPANGDLLFEIGYIYFHKFDSRSFRYADYYREQLKKEEDKDNYEQALYWVKRSLNHNSMLRKRIVIERTVCHILWRASLQAEKNGKLKEALEYAIKSIEEWDAYLERHPDDPEGIARSFLEKINEKKLQLEQKV
ncbi:MAG: hypothetical protein SCARUB_02030 [Candidatus Scalindua rubra]|uniref:Uncharacterized protein n=1 Tax=Candidatus Scalindua rubra TaxID=1872076 RepID=A0A1E3XCY7_9BACT|nr:MAG: hypothetical protein SCARUB_02030 [Candidatus Scalindua rubra]